jgi:A/G-specific adenine glycosylase
MPVRLIRIAALLRAHEFTAFREALLQWFTTQQRDLPWRRSRDPYAIWISEIMLQQTRVAAVIPFYERFMARFPDVISLANASEQDLLAHWAGLGYYYRARHLQRAAQNVRDAGAFPREYDAIRALPGIGDYTAAAIASISFDEPRSVLDGNVFRVLSRFFADDTNIASPAGKRRFATLADTLLDKAKPGAFNQAMMELGATVCLPRNPQCLVCPISRWCRARQAGSQTDFPVKIVPRRSVQERRMVFWIENDRRILAWQRSPTSRLMPGFWELPEREQLPDAVALQKLGEFRHGITFHHYVFELWSIALTSVPAGCDWIELSRLKHLPVSTVLKKAARLMQPTGQARATVRSAAASTG